VSAEESSPLEGAREYELDRPLRIKLIVIGVALVAIIAAYAYTGTGDRSLDIAAAELISQQQEDGLVCCIVHHEHDGEPYLLVVTRELEGEYRRVVLRVMEFTESGAPREINAIGSPFNGLLPIRFSVVDHIAYIPLHGEDGSGVWTVDLSDPAWPSDAGFVDTGDGVARQLTADGDLLAINHTSELALVDISDRTVPRPVFRIEQPESGVMTVRLLEDILFVNDAVLDEFRLFDVSNPETPALLVSHRNPDGPGELEIEFGAEGAPERLDQSAMPSKYLDFVVDRNAELVYIAASDLGLRLLDISDAADPRIVADMDAPDRVVRVALHGDRLYLLGASEGDWLRLTYSIHIVDISDRTAPEIIQSINGVISEPGIQAFTASDDRLFVGLFESLLVFDVSE
jgi:hypothetical protein